MSQSRIVLRRQPEPLQFLLHNLHCILTCVKGWCEGRAGALFVEGVRNAQVQWHGACEVHGELGGLPTQIGSVTLSGSCEVHNTWCVRNRT